MAEQHFHEQQLFAEKYLIPLLERHIPDFRQKRVLEVGCAEAGLLDYLQKLGMKELTGIELEASRVEIARKYNATLDVRVGDIADQTLPEKISGRFDVIIMRDVIEHVPNRESTFRVLWELLQPGGYLFITFPPRFSPFAGHQQHARSFLKHTPYVSLLPEFLWRRMGRWLGEPEEFLDSVMLNYRIGLSIRQFEKFYRRQGFVPVLKDLFLLRPIFKYRMGLPIIKFPNIPFFREFKTTGCEYLLRKPTD